MDLPTETTPLPMRVGPLANSYPATIFSTSLPLAVCCTPNELAHRLNLVDFTAKDHHYTGPLEAQVTFGESGALHHTEGGLLARYAATNPGHVLEIGADHGVSTRYIHDGLDQTGQIAQIVALDFMHKWGHDDHWPRRIRFEANSYTVWPQELQALLPEGESFSWAFIDGDHSWEGASRDTLLAFSLGIRRIFYHDTGPQCVPYKLSPAGHQSGSSVRQALLAGFRDSPGWNLYDIQTPCGMMYLEAK